LYVWTLKTRKLRQNLTNFRYKLDVVSLNEDIYAVIEDSEATIKVITKRV